MGLPSASSPTLSIFTFTLYLILSLRLASQSAPSDIVMLMASLVSKPPMSNSMRFAVFIASNSRCLTSARLE